MHVLQQELKNASALWLLGHDCTCEETFFITSQKVSCIFTIEFKLMLSDLNSNPISV